MTARKHGKIVLLAAVATGCAAMLCWSVAYAFNIPAAAMLFYILSFPMGLVGVVATDSLELPWIWRLLMLVCAVGFNSWMLLVLLGSLASWVARRRITGRLR